MAALFGLGFLAMAVSRGTALATRHPMDDWGITLIELTWVGLLAFTLEPGVASRIASFSWFGFFGRYSYGLYIISGMLLPAFLRVLPESRRGQLIWFTASFVVNMGLAMLSYHLLESRFLALKDRLAPRDAAPGISG